MLKGPDKVRKRPGVIFGSDGLDGCEHAIFEVISNSIDEARAGYGNEISVTRFSDGSVEVVDHGRGCPVDYNKNEERYNWELVYCELYAGGKYDADDETYAYSLGLNGLGLCATQFASRYMDVEIIRDGYQYNLHFERGENVGGLQKKKTSRRQTGTKTRWLPDIDVFTAIHVSDDFYLDCLHRQAVVNPNLKFHFRSQQDDGSFQETDFCYENGITDYVEEIAAESNLVAIQSWRGEARGKDRPDKPEYTVKFEIAFTFSTQIQLQEYYHNSSWLSHGGSPEDAVKRGFVTQFDTYLKQKGKYQKNESKIKFEDIAACLILVSSSFSTQTSYENQTKKAITNRFIYEAILAFLAEKLEVYFIENPDEAEKIAAQLLINKRSRETAEKTRLNWKKKLSGALEVTNLPAKFIDCRSREKECREIYIVEGDSALGSVKMARNSEFQAVIPVRGKILNCLKANLKQIFQNEIITDILKLLGCGVEVSSQANKSISEFQLDDLRWSKIIICTDADVDGFQIRTLILTMFYRLTPTLLREGYVYIAESPLFEITTKYRTFFAYTEKEKAEIVAALGDEKYTLQRSKGLGENEPEMMALTTMQPETRRLIQVKMEDVEEATEMFDLLLGDNLSGRKEFIAEEGGDYLELADIS